MNKEVFKRIFLLLVIFLILGTGGFFIWRENRKTPAEEWSGAKISPKGDYIIEESAEGKTVENKKAGLSFKIPDQWILKDTPTYFYSPDARFSEKRSDILEQGCEIDLDVSYIKTDLDILEKVRRENILKLSSVSSNEEFKRTEINNHQALRYGFNLENLKISYTWIDLPTQNQLYTILLISPVQEQKRCIAEFDKFLETISVK